MTQDYRPTIFLPQTDFPMRGNLPEKEPEHCKRWEEMGIYDRAQEVSKDRSPFILHDGPPYANGNIHAGHATNKILKDVIVRTQFKLGKRTPFVPGWDCHGLPIETKVEETYRKKGMNKDDVPMIQFRKECREFAQTWIDVQREEFKRLGIMGDWDHPYTTMTGEAEAEIVRLLGEFLLKGGLYRGVKPVMWSVIEKTALAEAEVEYKDHESHSIYVKFPISSSPDSDLKGAHAVIWTTTPWTIPANRAVAYGDDIDYVLLRIDGTEEGSLATVGDVLILAQDLVEALKGAGKISETTVLKAFKGSHLKGSFAYHPLHGKGYDFEVPLLAGEHVTVDAGTGLVHTAPSHGVEDFALGKMHNLDVPELVGDDGVYYDHVALFAGQHVYKVNPNVAEELTSSGKLLHHSKLVHSYPHSWRSKTPLIYRATPQWFISMETNDLRKKALDAIQKVTWYPKSGINRIQSMVEDRPDWCVSRQRTWGVPITVFVNKETGEPLRDPAVMGRIVEAVKAETTDVWYTADPQRFLGDEYKADDFEQVRDILDVWFDSGATHSFVLKARSDLSWPADLYLEGSDQHRGWFQSSLLVGCGVYGDAPYREVLTHGFLVDEHGRKMSKSQGNGVDPQSICKEMGADVLRLWVMGTDTTNDMRIGPELLKRQQDIYRRYRNTFRYLLGALHGYDASETVSSEEMPDLEKWILHRLAEVDTLVRTKSQSYSFQDIYSEIHHFCAVDLSAFYFDIRKDSLYCDGKQSSLRKATRTTMHHIFECLVRWLAPVLCFTTEEAWLSRYPDSKGSVHLETFVEIPATWTNKALDERFTRIRDIRSTITGALELERAEKRIGSSLQAHVDVYVNATDADHLKGVDVSELSITSTATLHTDSIPEGAFKSETGDVGVIVTLASGQKCERCWKVLNEVGSSKGYVDLCGRCADAVEMSDAA